MYSVFYQLFLKILSCSLEDSGFTKRTIYVQIMTCKLIPLFVYLGASEPYYFQSNLVGAKPKEMTD